MTTEKDVATALLGSWPSQVASWGKAGIAAYLAELAARGMTPETALVAIRSCPASQTFPPSAPELAGVARTDASVPTWAEAYDKIYGRRGVLRARPEYPPGGWTGNELQVAQEMLALERAKELDPSGYLEAFVADTTLRRLRMLHVEDPDHGELVRKELGKDWDRFVSTVDRRSLASIASGDRQRGLRPFDLHSGLNGHAPREPVGELGTGRDVQQRRGQHESHR